MPGRTPLRRYRVRAVLQAPLAFVYDWCTDYTAVDGEFSGEGYQRRLLDRSAQKVVFEDLYDTPHGWIWVHRTVTLQPPGGWHAESIGSDRLLSVDYRLTELAGGRTRLEIHATRRPYGVGTANPSKTEWERNVAAAWNQFGRRLEREYRRREGRGATKRKKTRGADTA